MREADPRDTSLRYASTERPRKKRPVLHGRPSLLPQEMALASPRRSAASGRVLL